MLRFLANNLEQLDLAREHIAQGDVNNARFGLMLTDNVVEITLHQIAKDHQSKLKPQGWNAQPYVHAAALSAALGQRFSPKVKYAKLLGLIAPDVAESVTTFHGIRNEVYHVGIAHEEILPALATFCFATACAFLQAYNPPYLGWTQGMAMPKRAERFFASERNRLYFPGTAEQYRQGCATLASELPFDALALVASLADHMEQVVEAQDIAIDTIATGGPHPTTRDQAVIDCQTWPLAFSDEGQQFAQDQGFAGSHFDRVKWLETAYPLKFKRDPTPSWRNRATELQRETAPHAALKRYRDFMVQTADIRDAIDYAHLQVEQYIDEQIDRMRGN